MKIIVATHNEGKVKEIEKILGKLGYEVISQSRAGIELEPEENGKTFSENALIKACAIAQLCDCAVIADDSGLCVEALGGAPGIYSARYAGENANDETRIAKLLSELEGESNRNAKFVSAVALVLPNGEKILAEGETKGKIALEPSGTDGFGYDPIFISEDLGKTFGNATAEEKNKVSHRFRSLSALYEILKDRNIE